MKRDAVAWQRHQDRQLMLMYEFDQQHEQLTDLSQCDTSQTAGADNSNDEQDATVADKVEGAMEVEEGGRSQGQFNTQKVLRPSRRLSPAGAAGDM
jgi:hypothetical protein